jgi:hypothetical protein
MAKPSNGDFLQFQSNLSAEAKKPLNTLPIRVSKDVCFKKKNAPQSARENPEGFFV